MKETLVYLLRNNCVADNEGRGVECTGVPGLVLQTEVGAEGSTWNSFQMETNISVLQRGSRVAGGLESTLD